MPMKFSKKETWFGDVIIYTESSQDCLELRCYSCQFDVNHTSYYFVKEIHGKTL